MTAVTRQGAPPPPPPPAAAAQPPPNQQQQPFFQWVPRYFPPKQNAPTISSPTQATERNPEPGPKSPSVHSTENQEEALPPPTQDPPLPSPTKSPQRTPTLHDEHLTKKIADVPLPISPPPPPPTPQGRQELRRYQAFFLGLEVARGKRPKPKAIYLDEGFLPDNIGPSRTPSPLWQRLRALRKRPPPPPPGLRNLCTSTTCRLLQQPPPTTSPTDLADSSEWARQHNCKDQWSEGPSSMTCVLCGFIAVSSRTMQTHKCPTILESRMEPSAGRGSLLTCGDIEENPGPEEQDTAHLLGILADAAPGPLILDNNTGLPISLHLADVNIPTNIPARRQLFQPMDPPTDHRDPSWAIILAECNRTPTSLSSTSINPAFLPSTISHPPPSHIPNPLIEATQSNHLSSPAPKQTTPQKNRLPPRVSPHRANHLSATDARPFKCPFDTCAEHQGWSSKSSLAGHLNAIHVRAQICPPSEFLLTMGMWVCKACWTLNMGRTGCKGDRCAALEPHERAAQAARSIASVAQEPILSDPADHTPFTPLSEPEPATGPHLLDILQNPRPLLRHVPRGARTAWTNTFASLINDLATNLSWEALQRLFLFPR